MLEVTHEGTIDVRRARKYTLVSKYKSFWMKNGETISELETRFIHIVNHLLGLGKTFEDDELTYLFNTSFIFFIKIIIYE